MAAFLAPDGTCRWLLCCVPEPRVRGQSRGAGPQRDNPKGGGQVIISFFERILRPQVVKAPVYTRHIIMLRNILHDTNLHSGLLVYNFRQNLQRLGARCGADLYPIWRRQHGRLISRRCVTPSPLICPTCPNHWSNSCATGTSLTLCRMAGQVLNRDYGTTAKEKGLVVDRVRDDDLAQFPIEMARLRTSKYSVPICTLLIAAYGWALQAKAVRPAHL